MKLNEADRKQVRLSLLRYGLRPRGFSLGVATSYLRGEGFMIDREEVALEIKYLAGAGKDLLTEVKELVSPEVKSWETTPSGRDYLALAGQDQT